jgi:hypothetical protein
MRKASIHITLDTLESILDKWFDGDTDTEALVEFIAKSGKSKSLSHRLILDSLDKKTEKKVKNTLKYSSKSDSVLFANTLINVRRKLKHRGISLIKESSKDWEFIRQGSELAFSFCKDFNLSKKEGFKVYIENALRLMVRFNLRQLNSKHEQICERYEAMDNMTNDPNKEITEKAYEVYIERVYSKTGMAPKYKEKQPEKYLNFIKVGATCKELGINPKDFIVGNFESLEWTSSIPMPEQLVTDNAVNRVIKWAAENEVRIGKTSTVDKSKSLQDILKKARG